MHDGDLALLLAATRQARADADAGQRHTATCRPPAPRPRLTRGTQNVRIWIAAGAPEPNLASAHSGVGVSGDGP